MKLLICCGAVNIEPLTNTDKPIQEIFMLSEKLLI